jgi:uncharacterized protein with GYD domain
MALYMTRATYSSTGFKGMVENPSDRSAAIKALLGAAGVTVHSLHFSPTHGQAVLILEGDAAQMTTVGMVVMSSGGFDGLESQELVTADQMHASMKAAQELVSKYAAPNRK